MKTIRHLGFFFVLIAFPASTLAEIKIAMPRDYNALANKLIGTREEGLGIENGTDVSGLTVNSIEGSPVALDRIWQEKPAMLIFYRGGWCPFCNAQVRELSMAYDEFKRRGIELAVISVDKPEASAMIKKTYDIPFPVLSDQDLAAHRAFNVVLEIPPERAAKAKETFGLDFQKWSDRDHLNIAVASAFLITTQGKVKWSTVIKDYTVRPSVEQLIAAIEQD